MAIRSDRLVVSLISDQGYYKLLFGHTKHNREGGRKEQMNKNGLGSVPSTRKWSLWHFLCILWAKANVYSSENSHKATSNADLNSRVGHPGICRSIGPSCHLSDLSSSLFFALLSSIDCLLLLSFVDVSLCWLSSSVLSWAFLPSSFRSRGRSRAQTLYMGFGTK